MRFGVLGSLRALRADGSAPALGGPRLRALLAMLLLDAGRVVTAERLLDGLYEGSAAVNALQSQVSRLRGVLDVAVERRPAGYLLAVDPAEVDVAVFERLVGQGRAAGTAGERAAHFGRALGVWRGPALADVRDAPFASGQVARLEELRLWAVEERVEAELALGRCGELVPELRELVADHPLRERLHGHLMRALYGDGRQGEALAAYEVARAVLADELGTDPSPALSTLHLAILRNTLPTPTSPPTAPAALGDASFAWGEGNATLGDVAFARGDGDAVRDDAADGRGGAPAAGGDAAGVRAEGFAFGGEGALVRGGVPAQFTSFVGREGELRALGEVLGRARLVTLVGAGGAGKTRLAIEAVNGEEACFVELGGLAEGADVAAAVLTALGLRTPLLQDSTQRSEGWGVERVVGALRARSLLVVLDNCEHLVAEVAG
ncbi:MAG: AfsR/SARP family transcriptional regulator, partial [Nonomuraea sp.]|nr:AfsR/SARP family transcriptional regulator [Nonomuraea sp.]